MGASVVWVLARVMSPRSRVSKAALCSRRRIDASDSGSAPFTEPQFALYSGTKSFTVYTYDDASNPAPGLLGVNTHVDIIQTRDGERRFIGIGPSLSALTAIFCG